jgi:exopolysaccharide biosynthesis predicted pyruvyltransferase EpsI
MTADHPITTADVLARYTGRACYLHEVSGNNGDELILVGSRFLLERAGCILVPTPQEADVLFINGGFKSDFWPFANDTIHRFSTELPDKALVILPSSFLFEETDFPGLFNGRTAPATILAREQPSLELLRAMDFPCEVEFGLDHDTAFALAHDPKIIKLRDRPTDRDLLIVERGDAERVSSMTESGVLNSGTIHAVAARTLPRPMLSLAARMVGRARRAKGGQARSAFAQDAVSLAASVLGRDPEVLLATDISRRSVCTYPEFCDEVARSEVIVSTRLHVAILGAVLGRQTYIVSGQYHKIPGIYEFSMADLDNVAMVNPSCEPIA